MVILPMAVKGTVVNLEVSFKNLEQQKDFLLPLNNDNYKGDFYINKSAYFGEDASIYERHLMEQTLQLHPEILTDFIRKRIVGEGDEIYVLTRNYREKDFCTKYKVPTPLKGKNIALDKLYGKLLNNLRLNAPERIEDAFLSFEGIGLNKELSEDTPRALDKNIDLLEYLDQLNFKTLGEEYEPRIKKALKKRPKKFVSIYKTMADENTKIYKTIYKLYHQIYETNPSWPKFTSQQKVYIKRLADLSQQKRGA